MIIQINEDRTIKKQYLGNEGSQNENKVSEIEFIIPQQYSNFTKKIVFMSENGNFTKDIDSENKYIIDNDVSKFRKILCYVWLTQDDRDFRSELFDMNFYCNLGESEEIGDLNEYNS